MCERGVFVKRGKFLFFWILFQCSPKICNCREVTLLLFYGSYLINENINKWVLLGKRGQCPLSNMIDMCMDIIVTVSTRYFVNSVRDYPEQPYKRRENIFCSYEPMERLSKFRLAVTPCVYGAIIYLRELNPSGWNGSKYWWHPFLSFTVSGSLCFRCDLSQNRI